MFLEDVEKDKCTVTEYVGPASQLEACIEACKDDNECYAIQYGDENGAGGGWCKKCKGAKDDIWTFKGTSGDTEVMSKECWDEGEDDKWWETGEWWEEEEGSGEDTACEGDFLSFGKYYIDLKWAEGDWYVTYLAGCSITS